jgi:hypothetical protein
VWTPRSEQVKEQVKEHRHGRVAEHGVAAHRVRGGACRAVGRYGLCFPSSPPSASFFCMGARFSAALGKCERHLQGRAQAPRGTVCESLPAGLSAWSPAVAVGKRKVSRFLLCFLQKWPTESLQNSNVADYETVDPRSVWERKPVTPIDPQTEAIGKQK